MQENFDRQTQIFNFFKSDFTSLYIMNLVQFIQLVKNNDNTYFNYR